MQPAILSAIFLSCAALAQSADSPTFEVASVKRSAPVTPGRGVFFGPARGGPGTSDPGQIRWSYATLKAMLMTAYDVKNYQVIGPAWLDTERYEIVAKVLEGATKEQVRAMWQNLIAERFRVTLHHESKEFQVEELVIAKGGSKLKESTEEASEPGPPKFKDGVLIGPGFQCTIFSDPNGTRARCMAKAQFLSQLTVLLGNQLHRPVLDKTGLTGKYDFTIEFAPDLNVPTPPSADNAAEPAPDLARSLPQQLGLRLAANKATLDVIVIDKAEKVPTEN